VKKEKEKQPKIKAGIKKRAFSEKQFHSLNRVRPTIHRKAMLQFSSNEYNFKSQVGECLASLFNALVGNQIVNYRYNDSFSQGVLL